MWPACCQCGSLSIVDSCNFVLQVSTFLLFGTTWPCCECWCWIHIIFLWICQTTWFMHVACHSEEMACSFFNQLQLHRGGNVNWSCSNGPNHLHIGIFQITKKNWAFERTSFSPSVQHVSIISSKLVCFNKQIDLLIIQQHLWWTPGDNFCCVLTKVMKLLAVWIFILASIWCGKWDWCHVWCQLGTRWCQFDQFDPQEAELNGHFI